MIWKTTLALLVTFFSLGSTFAQFSDAQPDLRETFTGNCTANSYTILDVYLSDINGTPISNELKSCSVGTTRNVYISVQYVSNAKSDNYNARIFADIMVDGELHSPVNYFKGNLSAANNNPQIFTLDNVSYNWTCGEELELTNFLVTWTLNANKDLSQSYTAADYNKAQCQFPPNIRISAPLAVEFDYHVCTTAGVATVNYSSTTSGGLAPYYYQWDFDSNGTIDATTRDASYNFSGNSTTTTLTVRDSENTSNSYTLTVNKPTEVVAQIGGNSELTCKITSLVLDASGSTLAGTPAFSWNTGENTSSITVTEAGEYTVTVTDATGCSDTASITVIDVPDSDKPSISCPADLLEVTSDNGKCYATNVSLGSPVISDNCNSSEELIVTNNAPTNFPIGETIVVWTVRDALGNESTCNQLVVVTDEQAPVITANNNITTTTDNNLCGAAVTILPATATDNCTVGTPAGTRDDGEALDALYPVGITTITWNVTDENGNPAAPVVQTITVTDNQAPVITADGPVNVPAEKDLCSAVVNIVSATATDNCTVGAPLGSRNDGLALDAAYPLGTTTITWTVTDANGNAAIPVTQIIQVTDAQAPVANTETLPAITGQCFVEVTEIPTATDNCDDQITGTTNDPLFYETQGTYWIIWTYTDSKGNTSTQEQQVIINDTTAPEAITLADAIGECEVTVVAPTTTDNCAGTITATTDASLTYTEQGNYEVTWTFNDGNGNISTVDQNVIVNDTTAPEAITIADAIGECEVTVVAPTTTDICAGTITATTDAPLTYTEQGNYEVKWTFNDGNGNITTIDQNVIVNDTTAPEAIAIADATGECEVTVVAPTTTDNCGGTITATTDAPQTYTEQGNYVVTWSFDDGNGNITTVDQNVIVNDTTAPEAVTLEPITGNCEVTVTAPTTQDNCSGTITGTTEDPLTYSELGTYQITWTFEDDNGNITTATQAVVVENTTAPVAPALADAVAECDITVAVPTTTNACTGETIEGTTNDPLTYTEQGEFIITWTFDDGDGNIVNSTQNVIVNDTTAPEAVTLDTITGNCEVTVTAPTTQDNCSGTITGTTEDPLAYSELGTYQITWTFEDDNGNITTATQAVVVENTTAPVAPALADAVAECDITVAVPTTTNACTGETIEGTTNDPVTYNEQGEFIITWTFDDGDGNIVTSTQNVKLKDITAPEAVTLADATGECEVTVVAPTTTDNCAGTITATTDAPLTYTEQGNYVVTWTFNDGNGNITTVDQNVIVNDTTAPEAITIADATGECEVSVVAPTTTDNCAGMITATTDAPLTYNEQGNYVVTWTFNDGNGNITTVDQNVIVNDTTAPEAIAIADATGECEVTVVAPTTTDNCAGTITATTDAPLTYTEQGNYVVTWTFNDGNGNITSVDQNVIVNDSTVPEAITLADATGECEVTVAAPATTDNCSGTITATTDAPLSYTEQGNYIVTWTFNDGNGNITTVDQKVIVNDTTAPESITIADATGECEVTVVAPTTTDDCAGTITATTDAPLSYSEQGNYVVTWTFNDGNGNITTVDQNVIVNDTTVPEAITLADATGECEVTIVAPTTTDNCAGTLTATTDAPLIYTEQGNYVVTWTFNDKNGNITTVDQNVIVNDTTAPEVITIADGTGECEVTVVAPTTTDNCAGTITATTDAPLTYSEQGNYVITWTFNDGNGNITTVDQNVIVNDTTAPEFITLADANGECEVTVVAPTTTDNCAGTITATTTAPLAYNEQGNYVITWTFNDGNGNITTVDQNVIVDDTTAPEAFTMADATGECEVTVTAPTTTDNCAGTITATTESPLTYAEQGNYVVTWTFNDRNGNITTVDQNVIVNDTTAPEAITLADATGECEVTVVAPTTTDNCAGTITATTEDALTYTEEGEYVVTWTFNDGNGNITSVDQDVIVNGISAPVVASTTQPTCDMATGSFSITSVAGMEYSLNGGTFGGTTSFTDLAPGTYSVTVRTAEGCVSEATSVTINTPQGTPAAPVIEELLQPTCDDPNGFVVLELIEGITFILEDADGNQVAENNDGFFEDLTAGTFTITARNEGGCLSTGVSFTVEEPQGSVTITPPSSPICDDSGNLDLNSLISENGAVTGTWVDTDQSGTLTGNILNPDIAAGFYTFTYVIEGACPSNTEITIEIEDCGEVLPCEVQDIKNTISKVVTPNGDQINDKFEVGIGLDCAFTYTLKVFNRWGNEVFSSNNYRDEWDGNSSNSVTGDRLPSGTYFYIVEIQQSGFEPIQGYIYLGTK